MFSSVSFSSLSNMTWLQSMFFNSGTWSWLGYRSFFAIHILPNHFFSKKKLSSLPCLTNFSEKLITKCLPMSQSSARKTTSVFDSRRCKLFSLNLLSYYFLLYQNILVWNFLNCLTNKRAFGFPDSKLSHCNWFLHLRNNCCGIFTILNHGSILLRLILSWYEYRRQWLPL